MASQTMNPKQMSSSSPSSVSIADTARHLDSTYGTSSSYGHQQNVNSFSGSQGSLQSNNADPVFGVNEDADFAANIAMEGQLAEIQARRDQLPRPQQVNSWLDGQGRASVHCNTQELLQADSQVPQVQPAAANDDGLNGGFHPDLFLGTPEENAAQFVSAATYGNNNAVAGPSSSSAPSVSGRAQQSPAMFPDVPDMSTVQQRLVQREAEVSYREANVRTHEARLAAIEQHLNHRIQQAFAWQKVLGSDEAIILDRFITLQYIMRCQNNKSASIQEKGKAKLEELNRKFQLYQALKESGIWQQVEARLGSGNVDETNA